MDPYYPNIETFGPLNKEAGVDRGMHQFFGINQLGKMESIDQDRWKQFPESSEADSPSAVNQQSKLQLLTKQLAMMTMMYLAGRYAGSWVVEKISDKPLNLTQKRSVGLVSLISATSSSLATTKMTN